MTPAQLRDLYVRRAGAMEKRPRFARASGLARVRLGDGFLCEVEAPGSLLLADLPPEEGGAGAAPAPSELMRAALAACLATSYRLWAARLDVPIDGVVLDILCEQDLRGQLGISEEVAVGWQRLVVAVALTSRAPEADLRRVVETANRRSPMLANLSPAIAQVHHLTVVRPRAGNDPFPVR
jgi:uncharacterized OsmC-like protein